MISRDMPPANQGCGENARRISAQLATLKRDAMKRPWRNETCPVLNGRKRTSRRRITLMPAQDQDREGVTVEAGRRPPSVPPRVRVPNQPGRGGGGALLLKQDQNEDQEREQVALVVPNRPRHRISLMPSISPAPHRPRHIAQAPEQHHDQAFHRGPRLP